MVVVAGGRKEGRKEGRQEGRKEEDDAIFLISHLKLNRRAETEGDVKNARNKKESDAN